MQFQKLLVDRLGRFSFPDHHEPPRFLQTLQRIGWQRRAYAGKLDHHGANAFVRTDLLGCRHEFQSRCHFTAQYALVGPGETLRAQIAPEGREAGVGCV